MKHWEQINLELLRELQAAHQIILNALNLMTSEQKLHWGAVNDHSCVVGFGTTRHHERAAVIERAAERTEGASSNRRDVMPEFSVPPKIATIIERLHTQDDRVTAHPLFAVQSKRLFHGAVEEYADKFIWLCDGSDVSTEEAAQLQTLHDADEPIPAECRRVGVIERWEFVTGCLTEQGCKDFLAANGGNLNEPRIYAYSGYRNAEFIAIREWLMSLRPGGERASDETGGEAVKAYLRPTDPGAFSDLKRKDSELASMVLKAAVLECGKCRGHGRWNLQLNGYGPGKHFQASCDDCAGWGYVPEAGGKAE